MQRYEKSELRKGLFMTSEPDLRSDAERAYAERKLGQRVEEERPRQDGEHGRATIAEIKSKLDDIGQRIRNLRIK